MSPGNPPPGAGPLPPPAPGATGAAARKRAVLAACAVAFLCAHGSPAADLSVLPQPRDLAVALTLYPDGRSWVREKTTVSVVRGVNLLPWPRAVAALEPDTFSARVASGSAEIVEVLPPRRTPEPGALLQRWVGHEVDLVEPGENQTEKVTRAILLGEAGGKPILRVNNAIWLAPPGWLRLPGAAGQILPGPEPASIRLASAGGGKATLEISYRTPGLAWSADYRAVRRGERLDFEGWITLRNDTEVDFREADVKLLAGDVQREQGERLPVLGRSYTRALELEAAAAPPPVSREPLGTTHLYTLRRPADLLAGAERRLLWVSHSDLPVRLRHRLESRQGSSYGGDSGAPPVHPATIVALDRGASGEPLPAGVVRLFERDASGALQEVGEDSIVHLPAAAPFDLRTGASFDLLAERRQTEQNPGGRVGPAELGCEIRLRNAGKTAADVEVREFFNGRWRIEESSHPSRRVDASSAEFILPVPAGGEATLTYRATVRY